MFVSSVALYLFVRKSNALKTPQQLNNLAMFLIPMLVYLALTLRLQTSFTISPLAYFLIIIQGFFFSYLGNVFSLKGIELAPNPGYSLIISKSYVIFTAIASVYIFSAPLTAKSMLAILLIVAFSTLVIFDNNKNRTSSNRLWLPYTIGAFFCWGFLALSSKYLLNIGVPILTRLILTMLVVTILILVEILIKRIQIFQISKTQMVTLVVIGILGSIFSYFMQVAFELAPNVGYVNATNAASISLLTLVSAFIFKDELTVRKMAGIVGVTGGLVLLFL